MKKVTLVMLISILISTFCFSEILFSPGINLTNWSVSNSNYSTTASGTGLRLGLYYRKEIMGNKFLRIGGFLFTRKLVFDNKTSFKKTWNSYYSYYLNEIDIQEAVYTFGGIEVSALIDFKIGKASYITLGLTPSMEMFGKNGLAGTYEIPSAGCVYRIKEEWVKFLDLDLYINCGYQTYLKAGNLDIYPEFLLAYNISPNRSRFPGADFSVLSFYFALNFTKQDNKLLGTQKEIQVSKSEYEAIRSVSTKMGRSIMGNGNFYLDFEIRNLKDGSKQYLLVFQQKGFTKYFDDKDYSAIKMFIDKKEYSFDKTSSNYKHSKEMKNIEEIQIKTNLETLKDIVDAENVRIIFYRQDKYSVRELTIDNKLELKKFLEEHK